MCVCACVHVCCVCMHVYACVCMCACVWRVHVCVCAGVLVRVCMCVCRRACTCVYISEACETFSNTIRYVTNCFMLLAAWLHLRHDLIKPLYHSWRPYYYKCGTFRKKYKLYNLCSADSQQQRLVGLVRPNDHNYYYKCGTSRKKLIISQATFLTTVLLSISGGIIFAPDSAVSHEGPQN